jgi:hypothetical protein
MYLDMDQYPNAAPYYNMNISNTTDPTSPGYYLHKPFFVIFNLAVGGNFPQIWNINQITALNEGNGYEAKMYVDFVKIYQKEADEIFTGLDPAPEAQTQYGIYPNPSNTQFRITGPATPETITLFNTAGTKVLALENTDVCDISGLPSGVYLVKINSEKNLSETFRVIKR